MAMKFGSINDNLHKNFRFPLDKIRQIAVILRHVVRILIKTSGKVHFIDILTAAKNEVCSTTTTENMTSYASFVFLALHVYFL